jgi:GNAT superfamily N-acetyltransferase
VKKSYRRKGLAFRLSADLINWSINNGLTPNWDAANRASKKLALKLGYVWQSDYRTLLVK